MTIHTTNNLICPPGYLKITDFCHMFVWHNFSGMTTYNHICKQLNFLPAELRNIKIFQHLFEAIEVQFPPILLEDKRNKSNVERIQMIKYLNIYRYQYTIRPASEAEGFKICSQRAKIMKIGSNMFLCKSGQYISTMYICDSIIDCPSDNSDEINC